MSPSVAELHSRPDAPRAAQVLFISTSGTVDTARPDPQFGSEFAASTGIRPIKHWVGTANTPGSYWCSTGDRLLPYDSAQEMRWLRLLDHDPTVTEIMTQPMTLRGIDKNGVFNHTPDIFARLTNGGAKLIEVKTDDRLAKEETIRAARLAAAAAQAMGWDYHLVTRPPVQRSRTVAWLAGARRLNNKTELREEVRQALVAPMTIGDLWSKFESTYLVKPATYNLLWHHVFTMDYRLPLNEKTIIWRND